MSADFIAKLLAPVDLEGDTFTRDIERDENASFHRLWVEAEAAAHAFQAAFWTALGARFYNRSEARAAGTTEAMAKVRAYAAADALMCCPALKHADIANKRRVYRLCGHGRKGWMKPWDEAIAADEARLRATRRT